MSSASWPRSVASAARGCRPCAVVCSARAPRPAGDGLALPHGLLGVSTPSWPASSARRSCSGSASSSTRTASCASRSASTRASLQLPWAGSSTSWSTSTWLSGSSARDRDPEGAGLVRLLRRAAGRSAGSASTRSGFMQRADSPPRRRPAHLAHGASAGRRPQPGVSRVVDQCIRRLLTAIRDWGAVINTSRNGTRVLIAIGELRKDLMELSHPAAPDDHRDALLLLTSLRQRVRLLSAFLEELSGAETAATRDPAHLRSGATPRQRWSGRPTRSRPRPVRRRTGARR